MIAAVEDEDQPREIFQGGLVLLGRQWAADLECAAGFDVGIFRLDAGQLLRRQRLLQPNDQIVAHVADAVIVAVEVPHLADGFVHVVGDLVEAQIVLADQAAGEELLLDVVLPVCPVIAAGGIDEDDRHRHRFARLHEREHFESFVHRPKSAGKQRDRVAGSHEHQLAREEIAEVDQLRIVGDEVIGRLLERQANRQPEGRIGPRAAMPGGHDSAARAGDDHPSRGGHRLSELRRLLVIGMAFGRAGRAENADLAHIAIRRKNLQRIAQLLERVVDQFDVAAIGAVAQKLERVGQNLADQVAIGNLFELVDQLRRRLVNLCQLLAADDMRRLGAFLRLLYIIVVSVEFLHHSSLACSNPDAKSSMPRCRGTHRNITLCIEMERFNAGMEQSPEVKFSHSPAASSVGR